MLSQQLSQLPGRPALARFDLEQGNRGAPYKIRELVGADTLLFATLLQPPAKGGRVALGILCAGSVVTYRLSPVTVQAMPQSTLRMYHGRFLYSVSIAHISDSAAMMKRQTPRCVL